MSPCHLIIATEFLSRGLEQLYSQHPSLRYITATSKCVSHLSFSDDIIIFLNGC